MSTSRCSTAFTDPEIPDQIASWMFSITSSGSGLADVLDCSTSLKYRSSTGGPPFLCRPTDFGKGTTPSCSTGGFPQHSGRYRLDTPSHTSVPILVPLPGSAGVDTLELGSLTNRLCIGSYRYECFRRPPEYAPRRSLPEGRYRPRGADNGRDTFAHKTIDADARVIGNPESILTKPGIMRQQLTLIAAVRVEQECQPQGP